MATGFDVTKGSRDPKGVPLER